MERGTISRIVIFHYKSMHTKHIALVVTLLLALVAGMFLFAYFKRAEYQVPTQTSNTPLQQEAAPEFATITAKHYYDENTGMHTLVGELPMPTPCDLLTASAIVRDNGANALVAFDVVNNSQGACAQVVTAQRFKVEFKAPEGVRIDATYKGKPVTLNLIPAGEGEDPSDFELFIKG